MPQCPPPCKMEAAVVTCTLVPWPGESGYYMGKAKWKPLDLLLSRKIVNQKECCITGGIVEISSTIKDLKDVGVVIPTTSPLYLLNYPVQKRADLRKWQQIILSLTGWWLQLQPLYQMWFHCLSNLSYPLVPCMQLLIWQMHFYPSLSIKISTSSLHTTGKARDVSSLS